MIVIPAIDIQDRRAVQLKQGKKDSASVYGQHPPDMARRWVGEGARRIHVVDLDGAFAGRPVNRDLVAGIVREAGDVPVQIGGGVRDLETIEAYLDAGVSQVIVGTRAVEDPEFLADAAGRHPGRLIFGLDARAGKAATAGWDETSGLDAVELAAGVRELSLFAIVFTDIERDGMLAGINAEATQAVAEAAGVPVIASGGVKDLDDIHRLVELELAADRLMGVITGSALYEGTLNLGEAQALLDRRAR